VAGGSEPVGPASPAGSGATGARREVTLYFATEAGRLRPEKRDLSSEGTAADQARRVVEALIEGPRGALSSVLPLGTGLRAIYVAEDGTAYLDLDAGFPRGLPAGSEDALVAVWSLTDTLAVNFPDVRRVKILVEGEEVRALGGHLDLSRPLIPDMGYVEGSPATEAP
jgi:spore germination protein GerM